MAALATFTTSSHLADIVDADDGGPGRRTEGHGSRRAEDTVGGLVPARELADEALAARARPGRDSRVATSLSRFRRSSRLCSRVLPKPIPGSMKRRSFGIPKLARFLAACQQEVTHLRHHIVIMRLHLHRRRASPACASGSPGPAAARPTRPSARRTRP